MFSVFCSSLRERSQKQGASLLDYFIQRLVQSDRVNKNNFFRFDKEQRGEPAQFPIRLLEHPGFLYNFLCLHKLRVPEGPAVLRDSVA